MENNAYISHQGWLRVWSVLRAENHSKLPKNIITQPQNKA